MTAQIKVKVQRKGLVKLKVLPRFPSSLVADNTGIIITKTGQTYTFSLDPSLPLVTPDIGAATGTSLALGGPLIGSTLSTQGTGIAATHVSKQTDGSTSTTGAAGYEATSDLADVFLAANGTARTTVRYGLTLGGYSELTVVGGTNGLIVGTATAAPVIIGTNDLVRVTFSSAGAVRFNAYGTGTLITDASGNITANTETGTGNSVRATTPTLTTPVLTTPSSSGGTFTSPTLVTPALGAATGTSIALGGALISGVIFSTQGTGITATHVSKQTDGASSTTGAGGFEATSDVADVALIANGTARTTVRYGLTLGGYSELTVFGGTNGLIVGTNTAAPVIIGTNNISRLTLSTAGAARLHAYGTGTLITDVSGNVTANTETGSGNSVRATAPALSSPVLTTPALGTPSSGVLTSCTGLPLSGLVAQAAYTFVGNNTGGSAVPTAVDIAALTTKASPAAGDYVMISDQAASGAWKKSTVSSVASAGSVASINGQTGSLALVHPPQGRLTLQTVTPVMTTTQSAKTTIYYTPYAGNQVVLYDGTNMVPTTFAEISVLTTDTTKNPAAIGASKVNDWFIWTDAGTLRLTHGPDWTNDTTRSAGTALVLTGGILLNNASITNGPAASRGTYVGTTRSNGSSQLDWIFGAAANGGTAGFFGLWNAYNRVVVGSMTQDTTDNWSYNSNTIRQMNASAGNQHTIVRGLDEDAVTANLILGSASGVGTTYAIIGIGLDSTTAFTGLRGLIGLFSGQVSATAQYSGLPGIGAHVISANERTLLGSATFVGDDASTTLDQTGLAYTGKH